MNETISFELSFFRLLFTSIAHLYGLYLVLEALTRNTDTTGIYWYYDI